MSAVHDHPAPVRFPVTALMRHEAREDRRTMAVEKLRTAFAAAVQTTDVTQPAGFGPGRMSVADVMADAMANNTTFSDRAMQILANAAAGRGTQRDAQQLLADMGEKWADMEATS